MKKNYFLIAALLTSAIVSAQDTGWLSPTNTAAPNGWTNPANAYKSDDVWATVAHQSGCRCPFIDLSWDAGTTYTTYQLAGPFGTTDSFDGLGSSTDTWGRTWTTSEFSNANFRLRIANPSTLIKQGYADFNFNIPANSNINGIEVQVEQHGDANYTMEYVDLIQVKVHYTVTTGFANVASSDNAYISIMPNPARSNTTIKANNDLGGIAQVALFDIQGRNVRAMSADNATELELNLEGLHKGIYLVQVTGITGKMSTKKIVIE